jgi:POLQ-like helicase
LSYSDLFAALPEIKKNIGHAVGVTEKYLLDRSFGHQPNTPHKARYERIAKRFYCALILCELIHEAKVWDVSKKYRLPRGDLEALMTSAASFGGMMVSFSKRMGWWDLEVLLSNAVQRLGFGVKTDILPLVEIKGVKAARARALWNAGYRSVRAVASAKVEDLLKYVRLGPFAER